MRRASIHVATVACALLALGFATAALPATGSETKTDAAGRYRKWIAEMKEDARGPFSSIKWFCKDGRVLAPKDFSCAKKGEGWQHGEWSDRTKQLRSQGYKVANVLAGIDASKAVADPAFPAAYAQLLVEKFLIATDSGWILRNAQFYRGAIQEEDEREAARNLLTAMAARDEWIGYRYPALRAGVRLLPHGAETASAQRVRNMAAGIADRDPAFQRLRVKIHGSPDASDAASVRDYASKLVDPALKQQADALAAEIDRVYAPRPLGEALEANARAFAAWPWLQATLRDARDALSKDSGAVNRYLVTANLLASLRDALPKVDSPAARLRVLDLSLAAEAENFRAAAELRTAAARAPRGADVLVLAAGVEAAYGTGTINGRERAELRKSFARLAADEILLGDYLRELRYLGLAPGWGTQGLRLHFGEAMEKLGEIEPLAELFIQDQLRGSPLLFYSQVLDDLARDANRLAGVQHKLFGRDIGAGFNALNPGLARGVLHANPDMKRLEAFRPDGIYVLPESVADLPPLAGILTAGAGNPLSHVQLLARNLGIPNVAVDQSLLPALRQNDGKRIVLAVSPSGLVQIADDGPQWDAVFGKEARADANIMFEPDLKKLDLSARGFVSLDALRAKDSGRIVGPKAAKLGELKSHFPDRVAPGVGIPFGLYRATVLDRPYRNSGKTVYEWMVESFRKLEAMPAGSREAAAFAEKLRAEIYSTILKTDPGPQFRAQLRAAMAKEFGADFRGGVFVRSDTNVEDLPGFTGAGLNLTLFNIVGFDNVVKAISEVWASPYTPRAWAWRQSHMKGPEHVYPAVLLLKTVPSDISGVMITQDVDTGDQGVLSVAVNEGVGGAVEGQAAESVRVDRKTRQRARHGHGDGTQEDGAAGRGRDREGAGLGAGYPAHAERIQATHRVRRRDPQGVPAARRRREAGRGRRGVCLRERQAVAAADQAVQRKPCGARGESSDPDGQSVGGQSQQDGKHARGGPMKRSLRYGKHLGAVALAAAALSSDPALAYPLDGYPETGIRRLEGMRLANEGVVKDVKQPPGAMLGLKDVDLRLLGQTFDLPAPDPVFTQRVDGILTGSMDDYGLAVLDLTDPARPRYAEHRGDHRQNVGSVGKLVVALALFQALADTYPGDVDARKRVLKDTVVTADGFSQYDSHTVRIFDPKTRTLTRRAVQIGDRATLYEWVDWMLSPSSNSAAGMVMREDDAPPAVREGLSPVGGRDQAVLRRDPEARADGAVRPDFQRTHYAERSRPRHAPAGELLHRDREAEGPRRR